VIPAKVAAAVLWRYGEPGGVEPGGFVKALLEAFAHADPMNHRLLAMGFAEYGEAMWLAQNRPGGIEKLRAIVGEAQERGASGAAAR